MAANGNSTFSMNEMQMISALVSRKQAISSNLNALSKNSLSVDHVNIAFIFKNDKDLLDSGIGGSNLCSKLISAVIEFYSDELQRIDDDLSRLGVIVTEDV